LTLEDPWLAAALSDGTVALLNTEVAMRQRHQGRPSSASLPPRRVFQLPGGAAYCADLADQWLVAGSGQYCVQMQVEMLNLFGSQLFNRMTYNSSIVYIPFSAWSVCTCWVWLLLTTCLATPICLHLLCSQHSSNSSNWSAHLKIQHESAIRQAR